MLTPWQAENMTHTIAGWTLVQQQLAPKLLPEMTISMSREIVYFVQRLLGRYARMPAKDIALWLSCVPLVLPAPLVAGTLALSERIKGDSDPRWNLVMVLSVLNFLLSAVAIVWISTLFGDWLVDKLHELLGPLFFWPSTSGPPVINV